MFRNPLTRSASTFALAMILAAGMTAAPISVSQDLSLELADAQAKGGGKGGSNGGNGGGKGGGNGNGKGGGNKSAAGGETTGHGKSGSAPGHNKTKSAKSGGGLGSLSASNASPTARANAAPNSRVGKIAAYEEALAAGNVEAAAEALGSAANKEITPEVVAQVNANLGIEATPEEEAEIAALAEEARTSDGSEGEDDTAEGEGDGEGAGSGEDALDAIAQAVEDLFSGGTTDQ